MSGAEFTLPSMTSINDFPTDFTLPTNLDIPADVQQDILEAVWRELVQGESDITYLSEVVLEWYEDEYELSEADANTIVEALLAYRRTQLTTAKAAGTLQPSRLTAAFDELNEHGISALQNFSCCSNCGSHEAIAIMEEEDKKGYIYFHTQDTETLIESGETYLGYGVNWQHICTEAEFDAMTSTQRDATYQQACQEMANQLLQPTFAKHGIDFDWDGNLNIRMHISNADFFMDLDS